MAAAGDDPVKLRELATAREKLLGTARYEAMTRRQENKTLTDQLKTYKDAEEERTRKGKSDLENAQADLKKLQDDLAAERKLRLKTEAKSEFTAAGATEKTIDSVLLHWEALPEAEREATTPKDWAAKMKAEKDFLFKPESAQQPERPANLGGNPNHDQGGTGTGGTGVITHPKTQTEIKTVFDQFEKSFSN